MNLRAMSGVKASNQSSIAPKSERAKIEDVSIQQATKAERYVAFLATYIPRLATVASFVPNENSEWRNLPLIAALDYASDMPGLSLEFGVWKGSTINYCAKRYPDRQFVGFDSFEGFPEDGRKDWTQDFSTGGNLPKVPDNVRLVKGYFCNSLPSFLEELDQPVALVNIDCDIYSSTKDIFEALSRRGYLRPGLPLAFDELINYRSFLWNEMLALFEMLEETGMGLRWLSAHQQVRSLDDAISLLDSGSYPTWADDVANGYRQQASLVLTDEGLDLSVLTLPWCGQRIRVLAGRLTELAKTHAPNVSDKFIS